MCSMLDMDVLDIRAVRPAPGPSPGWWSPINKHVISCWAETNSAPSDFPEAEAEVVAAYNPEYSSTLLLKRGS